MIRGTTPLHIYTLPFGIDNVLSLRIIYAQRGQVIVTKTLEDCTVEGSTVNVKLTQEDTLAFAVDAPVEIQLRVLMGTGDALASQVIRVKAGVCLEDEVIT